MKPVQHTIFIKGMALAFLFTTGLMTLAQDGKLHLHVRPQQAYIFVDGHAVGEASKHPSITVSAGDISALLPTTLRQIYFGLTTASVAVDSGAHLLISIMSCLEGARADGLMWPGQSYAIQQS